MRHVRAMNLHDLSSTTKSRVKLLALVAITITVLLAAALVVAWPRISFSWRFEALGRNPEGYLEYRHRQTGIRFVRLPGGTVSLGVQADNPSAPNYDPDADPDDGPVHDVTLSPFLIAKYELSVAEWKRVMGSEWGSLGYDSDPVAASWNGVQVFEERTGLTLPSEAQWEYACWAGTKRAGEAACRVLDWELYMLQHADHRVGWNGPNGFGLYDIHGNFVEWCEDVWNSSFYSTLLPMACDPVCTSGSASRVVRGFKLARQEGYCRLAGRFAMHPELRCSLLGFRPAIWPVP
jgi:formylglycine-generating enzyme required for sulfatase activity